MKVEIDFSSSILLLRTMITKKKCIKLTKVRIVRNYISQEKQWVVSRMKGICGSLWYKDVNITLKKDIKKFMILCLFKWMKYNFESKQFCRLRVKLSEGCSFGYQSTFEKSFAHFHTFNRIYDIQMSLDKINVRWK